MRVRDGLVVVAVLVALVAASGAAAASARGEPELSVFAPDNELSPGEDAELELFLQNAGDVAYADSPAEQARVTTARDVVVTLSAGDAPVTVEAGAGGTPVGNLPEGLSAPVAVPVSVDEDAAPGTYELPVTVAYTHTQVISRTGAHSDRDATLRSHVELVVADDASFRVVSASASGLFGDGGPVTLVLENVGSATARDATVAIESGAPQLSFGGDRLARTFVGEWAPGETRAVTVEGTLAEGADRRRYPLSATVSYEGPDGEARESEPRSVGVAPRAGSRFALADVASSLAVGEEGTVSGTVVNNGDTVARDAVVVLSADTRNLEPVETEYAVGDLAPGGEAAFGFDAEVGEAAAGGPRQLSFSVRYRDRSGETVESDPLVVRVDVGPARETFAVEPVSASLRPGATGRLRLEVTNRGDEPVTDVAAKLFANAPLSTTDDEAFIDRLEPGATEEIVFGVGAGAGALNKTYPVSLDFRYDDADGDTLLSDTYHVPVTVTERAGGGGLPLALLGGAAAVVLVGGAVGYLALRRR